ncbi:MULTISPECIES: hypothetical protein [unclassified Pseudomonas]|uniref:hypothetical protein n=1 Tax=unclassified Pseudomonas TaxID=196821 RepID=UPI00244C2E31|nr:MULTISPECIES: hypothetical protein [unclassified Pseudomonas]MDH0301505.1 hypothetical protein [Pseudomonas sp. GD04091]MDH1985399.1 hypothetical protein [Pseudomonas sp. GD03689]
MKRIACIAVLATSLVQVAYGNEPAAPPFIDSGTNSPFASSQGMSGDDIQLAGVGHYGGVAPFDCPPGTYPTSIGHCQPAFDFD